VFEREGKLVVYVKTSSGFEPRLIKPLKRSESTMVVAEGLKAGELIALANPVEKPGSKKKGDKKQETGNPMGAMPTGGPKS
jgi:hypothetical protein